MAVDIRRASPEDIPALRTLAVRSFEDAYGDHNPDDVLNDHMEAAFSESQLTDDLENKDICYFLAWSGDDLIGYIKLANTSPPNNVDNDIKTEVERIYTDPNMKGRGIGKALMKVAYNETLEKGEKKIWLGVWKPNTDAFAFYRAQGFEVIGEKIFMMGGDPQDDYIMAKNLTK